MQFSRPSTWLVAAVATLALGVGACGGERPASGDVSAGPAGDAATTITATDNEFEPAPLSLPAGNVTVDVVNDGDDAHNFVIDALDVSTGTIEPGRTVSATFDVPAGGVDFVCTFHSGMTGRIEVAP